MILGFIKGNNMKILQINCVYDFGSTGKITKNIHDGLKQRGYESIVIYGRRKKTKDKDVYKLCTEWYAKLNNLRSRIDGMMYSGCFFSTRLIIKKIQKEKPDVIHIQCINGYFCNIFKLLSYIKKSGIPTILTLHAEFMYTANCSHAGNCDKWKNGCNKCSRLKKETKSLFFDKTDTSWKRMHSIYKDWKELTVVACSHWIAQRVSQSGEIKHRKIVTIQNGIDIENIFYPRLEARNIINNLYGISEGKNIVLFVAPEFSELKGFDQLLRLIRLCEDVSIHFLLVGDIYNTEQKNVTVVGKVYNQDELANLYSAADVLVVCSRNDTYPTVCLEAISCGTPVVGFDVGGVNETIANEMGKVVPFGNIDEMKHTILEMLNKTIGDEIVNKARRRNSNERMVEDYIDLYKKIYVENKEIKNQK